jgi:hypothetical protein
MVTAMVIVVWSMMSGPANTCQGGALTTASFEAYRLPLTILVRHPSPAMMIDLTGSEKTILNEVGQDYHSIHSAEPRSGAPHSEFSLWTFIPFRYPKHYLTRPQKMSACCT